MTQEIKTTIDELKQVGDGVMWREVTITWENGEEASRSYHRGSVMKGDDITSLPADVQAFCAQVWNV